MANKKTAPRSERAGGTSGAKKAKRNNTKKQIQKAVAKAYNREKKALAKSLAGAGASAGIKAGKAMKKQNQSSAQKAYAKGTSARNATKTAQYKADGLRREGLTPTERNTMRANARTTQTPARMRPITNTSARMEQKKVKRNLIEEHKL